MLTNQRTHAFVQRLYARHSSATGNFPPPSECKRRTLKEGRAAYSRNTTDLHNTNNFQERLCVYAAFSHPRKKRILPPDQSAPIKSRARTDYFMSAVRRALNTARSITPTSPKMEIISGKGVMNTLHSIIAALTSSEPTIF